MAANQDHIRRDAEHAARSDIAVFLSKFQRRMYEEAKAHSAEAISGANGGVLDGTGIGRDAASRAIRAYISSEALDAIEPHATEIAEEHASESAGL